MDVSDLAKVIGYEVDLLLEAINQAGLSQLSPNDNISTEDRKKILEHIKSTKKGTKKTISIAKRKTEIKNDEGQISITRFKSDNQSSKEKSSSGDLSGTIDFETAEKRRVQASSEKKIQDEEREKRIKDSSTKVIRKSKQEQAKQSEGISTAKKPSKTQRKDLKKPAKDSKLDKKEQEGEKYLESQLASVQKFEKPAEFVQKEISIPETISVAELSKGLSVKSSDLIKTLMNNGIMATVNQSLDQETAVLITTELGHVGNPIQENEAEEKMLEGFAEEGEQIGRDAIVSVLGHVDHGKTSLLDYIRNSSVADKEEGGITQSIGAYQVSIEDKNLTFIDTPGHAAFSKMRARGANSTDIVILVVAADDGVQPQTVEAINHAKAAEVQIVVAINKIDKPEADVDKIKGDLAKEELVADDWGGDVQMVPVSAQSGEGIPELLETIFLVSEIMDLKASFEGPATGVVLESGVKRGEGAVATLLIQQGSLNTGDFILVGDQTRKIRALKDFNDKPIKKAKPSSPVSVSGLEYPPSAGDQFYVLKDEKTAKNLSEERATKEREKRLSRMGSLNSENIFANADGTKPSINLILKSDSNGTLEALTGSVLNMKVEEVNLKIVLDGVGSITENDVNLAIASEATIFGYNVRADTTALNLAESEGIDIKYFGIIYDLLDSIKTLIEGSLEPEIKERQLGIAEVKELFKSPKFGLIAGSMVTDGSIMTNKLVRVLRDNIVIHEGKLDSLRRFKDEASEVKSGTECGIGITNYTDAKVGDVIEVYERQEIARKLES
ncbi:MAG: translation initiation factor IF-2 [Gammaproteobacteria bacterium]